MSLGKRIKEIRKSRKITLKALGEQSNLSSSFLCDVEKERTKPSIEALERIANVLETSVSYLIGETTHSELVAQSHLNVIYELLQSKKGSLVLNYLSDFNNWGEIDQEELLKYLQIKQQLRNIETGA